MKLRYLFIAIATSLLIIAGCAKPEELIYSDEGVVKLSVKGRLVADESFEYDSKINYDAKTISVQIPYYISDTEKIQGDITKVRLFATLPIGSKFEPSISGIHNLLEGFSATLVDRDGNRDEFTFKADYVKSNKSELVSCKLKNNSQVTMMIKHPKKEGEKGEIIVYTTPQILPSLKNAQLEVGLSPWATSDCPTTAVNLFDQPEITVTAQDETNKSIYKFSLEAPELVGPGMIGYTYSMFGYQLYQGDGRGFVAGANRTMAVIGDYLVISNSADVTNMLVLDRFTGNTLPAKVNTTGISKAIYGITSDDAGHLVGLTYTNNSTQTMCEVWVWANGIEFAPKKIFEKDLLTDAYFESLRGGNQPAKYDIGHTIYVKGNILSGKAVLGTASSYKYRVVFLSFIDGVASTPQAQVELHYKTVSMGDITKTILLNTEDTPEYFWTIPNDCQAITYVPAGTRTAHVTENVTQYTVPSTHWYTGGQTGAGWSAYWKDIKGVDYVEFNGLNILAIQNAAHEGPMQNDNSNRLYVASVNNKSNVETLISGYLFDSIDGEGIPGVGYGVTGRTSSGSFDPTKTVLGSNPNKTGDVCIGKTEDAIQIYMLTTDHGLIAFEVTKYNIN